MWQKQFYEATHICAQEYDHARISARFLFGQFYRCFSCEIKKMMGWDDN